MNKEEFLKKLKNKNNQIIYLILIIGVIFMIVLGGDKQTKKEQPTSTVTAVDQEKALTDILADIKGVGEVRVMITYYGGVEKDLAYETKKNQSNKDLSESEDKKAVLSSGEPVVVREKYPEVKGVIVTAQGAGNVGVKKEISEAVQTALDVPAHKVSVYVKE